jgi:Beta-propeller repeat
MQKRKLKIRFLVGCSVSLITGCGGGMSGGGGGTTPTPGTIYVTQILGTPLPSSILEFPASAEGSVTPTSTIKSASNVIFSGLTVDSMGSVYATAQVGHNTEIFVYAPGANGTATPNRTITATSLDVDPQDATEALAVDASGNIYISAVISAGQGVAFPAISVFSSTATGASAPTKMIGGSATNISFPGQIAVDSADNIYVVSSPPFGLGSILIFDSNATGNAAPTGTLAGSETTITTVQGVAVDGAGNIYVAANGISILEFSPGSSGNVAPIRTISGLATTITEIGNLALDGQGNVYALTEFNVLKFGPNATGNVAPNGTFTSTGLLLSNVSIAVH